MFCQRQPHCLRTKARSAGFTVPGTEGQHIAAALELLKDFGLNKRLVDIEQNTFLEPIADFIREGSGGAVGEVESNFLS